MKNKNGKFNLWSILIVIILIVILINAYKFYKKNFFNGFDKATLKLDLVEFKRDSNVKYSKYDSYRITNTGYNDSSIIKEIEVEPNTPYKVTCMVKTDGVICEDASKDGGVSIGIMETTESCKPIIGNNEWQQMEFMFNSKNRDTVKLCFRIGGNENNCIGQTWFSDFKIEKGIKKSSNNWKVGCFIMKNVDVNIDGKEYKYKVNYTDIENVKLNMSRYKEDCYKFSDKQMTVDYEIYEIEEPITKITYSEEHGYYFDVDDIKDLVYNIAKEDNLEHIFIVCRMEDEQGKTAIPINGNWVGLGGMEMYGIGYSIIRLNKNANVYVYQYGITNQAPEEVYVHEFLHTLEHNEIDYGYDIPALHDYEKYGYEEASLEGLNDWYIDYMRKNILDKSTNTYIGLDSMVYNTQPITKECFKYPIEVKFVKEPENIIEEFNNVIKEVLKRNK